MPDTAGIPACAADPELMFPPRDSLEPRKPNKQEREALRVCAGCPVLATCREAALGPAPIPFGVAGGLTLADRRAIRAAQWSAQTEQAPRPESAEKSAIPAPRVAPDEPPAPAARPVATVPARVARLAPPPSASAPSVTPAALAVLNRTPTPASERTPPRKGRKGRAAVSAAPASPPAPVVVEVGDELDELIARLLRAYPASLADAATVRELVLERGPAAASRWEVAVAAMVLLARDTPAETTARLLGEDGKQVRRWRERRDAGRPLVLGGPGTGTHRLARPARLVATTTDGASVVDAERGAA